MNGKTRFLSGAVVLGAGAFFCKLIGAIYRVPLTNLLGGNGLGIYQAVFPVYAVLLDFSGAGVPSALSKIVSSEKDGQNNGGYLSVAIKLFLFLGLICSLLMAIFSKKIAILQGVPDAVTAYLFLSPAVVLVSLISCFRGYFQGKMRMSPTAISQILEQLAKLSFGILLVKVFLPNIKLAVAGATLAITISELIALVYLYLNYKKDRDRFRLFSAMDKMEFNKKAKRIIKVTVPVTLTGIMIPLSQVIDSFLIVNILSAYRTDATALFGLLSGATATVIALPVSICYGLATASIPAVSSSVTESERENRIKKALVLTLIFTIPCAIALYFLSPFAVRLLFNGLSVPEKSVVIKLLKLGSPCIVLLSFLQTSNAVLIGKGKLYLPVFTLGVGIIIKTVLNLILLKNPQINIYGGQIAVIACYFTVSLLNLLLVARSK